MPFFNACRALVSLDYLLSTMLTMITSNSMSIFQKEIEVTSSSQRVIRLTSHMKQSAIDSLNFKD